MDEEVGIKGASGIELSKWWGETAANFQGSSPTLHDLIVDLDEKEVVALLFAGDRAPMS
jgi:hypothetical protein